MSSDIVFATTAAMTTEAFIQPVARELVSRGHRIHLVSGDRPPQVNLPIGSTTVLPMARSISAVLDLRALVTWVSFLRELRPQMVVAGTPKASLLAMLGSRIAGVPARVYVIHGAVWDGASGLRRHVLEAAERVTLDASTSQIAVSDSLARMVQARGLARRAPQVLGSGSFCGVDVDRFSPAPQHPTERPTMIFIGRLHRDKGVDALLRVLQRVRAHVDARLLVVGSLDETMPPDDATMRALHQSEHVEWVGEQVDVVPFLRKADLLLFPTRREGLPQVPLEAQACAVPVVSWRATGVIDAVRDGFTGVLVPFADEVALADAATDLLRNEASRTEMARNARMWAEARFSEPMVAARNADFLEALLGVD